MSDGDIEVFLDNFPLLEKLIVHGLEEVSNLEICGSSLMLKHLDLVCWSRFESHRISAPRLTTLVVTSIEGVLLENVPMLVNTLSLGLVEREAIDDLWEQLPQMPKLKKLEIDYGANRDASLIRLAAFIRASPSLEEFVLLFNWSRLPRSDREVFKFCGYYGRMSDAELLGYILKNCIVLEKITVDPSGIVETRENEGFDVKLAARKNAKQQLQPQVPRHVELIIL